MRKRILRHPSGVVYQLRDDGYRICFRIVEGGGVSLDEEFVWAEYKHCQQFMDASQIAELLMVQAPPEEQTLPAQSQTSTRELIIAIVALTKISMFDVHHPQTARDSIAHASEVLAELMARAPSEKEQREMVKELKSNKDWMHQFINGELQWCLKTLPKTMMTTRQAYNHLRLCMTTQQKEHGKDTKLPSLRVMQDILEKHGWKPYPITWIDPDGPPNVTLDIETAYREMLRKSHEGAD